MIESLESKSLKQLPSLATVDADIEATQNQLDTLKKLRRLILSMKGEGDEQPNKPKTNG